MRWIRMRTDLRAALVATTLVVTGCSDDLPAPIPAASGEAAEPTRGGTLRLASFADLRGLDPANITDGLAPPLLEAIFAGLVDYDAEGRVVPDLATRWDVEEGGRLFRFHLREGVRMHDGAELEASDVKRSVERALSPGSPNPYASYFSALVGFDAFQAGKAEELEGVAVEGRYVVSFRLAEPDAVFLGVLAMPVLRPTCRSAGRRYEDGWSPCGAGPFLLRPGEWDHGRRIVLRRHEAYFRPGLPRLDAVEWTFHVSGTSQRFKLERGDLDVVRDLTVADVLRFQADPRWKPFGDYEADKQVNGEAMNVELEPFDRVDVRRAVAYAIDREQLIKVRAQSLHTLDRPVPPGVFGYDPAVRGQRHDLALALEHMKRAGLAFDPRTGEGGWPHPIPYLVYRQGLPEMTAQVLAQQLARIGLRLEIRIVSYPTFIALRGRRKAVAFGPGSWQQDFPDALSYLEPLFHSSSINDESSNNWSFWKDARFDELVTRARHEMVDADRLRLMSEAQQIVCDDAPWAFTHGYRAWTQRQPYVRELRPHAIWTTEMSRTWIDRAPVALGRVLGRGPRSLFAALVDDHGGTP